MEDIPIKTIPDDTIECECGQKYHASVTDSWMVLNRLKEILDGIDGKIEIYILRRMINELFIIQKHNKKGGNHA